MQRWRTIVLLLLVSITGWFVAYAADGVWGVWTDRDESHYYAFLKNSEFKFRGLKFNPKLMESERKETDGVWRSGDGICWIGDKKQQTGNVLIYVDSLECCMLAQFLGNKLVLSEVWQKGYHELNICSNRVLTRSKTMPAE